MAKFKFKPDKDIDNADSNNGMRAQRAHDAIFKAYAIRKPNELEECNAQDMISDIFHLCDREGWNVGDMVRMATNNWTEER